MGKQTLFIFTLFCIFGQSLNTLGFSANKVFWRQEDSFVRIVFQYTIPELLELREAYVEIKNINKALEIYKKLQNGADFYLTNPNEIEFREPTKQQPW